MSEQDCGSCDHQGDVNHPQKKVECLVDGKVYEQPHSCEDFKEYVQGKTSEARLAEALEVSRRREAKAARESTEKMEQMKMEYDKELTQMKMKHDTKLQRASLRFQLLLVVFGFVIGIVGTLITQAILK